MSFVDAAETARTLGNGSDRGTSPPATDRKAG
jgi:hypothetical protein